MRTQHTATLIAGIALMLVATLAHGQSFSVFAGGPTPAPGDDILNPGPIPILVGGGGLPGLEVDGLSWGHQNNFAITGYEFSVDPGSVGSPATAVAAESASSDHPADIYGSAGGGLNGLVWDGDGVSTPLLAPSLGLFEQPFPADNLDGWDNRLGPGPSIFYSLDLATAPAGGGVGADVFLAPSILGYDLPPTPTIYAGALALGLDTLGAGTDDLDALVVFDHSGAAGVFDATDFILFSLTAGSASLVSGSGTIYDGLGAEDILTASASGIMGLHLPGSALGLAPGDNLDALDVIPEPNVVLLILAGGTGLYIRKRLMPY